MASGLRTFRSYIVQRKLRRGLGPFCASMLGCSPFILLLLRLARGRPARPPPEGIWLVFCASVVLVGAVIMFFFWRAEWRFRAFLREHKYHLCTQCGYALNPEHQGRPCPECGTPVDLAACKRAWERYAWGRAADKW